MAIPTPADSFSCYAPNMFFFLYHFCYSTILFSLAVHISTIPFHIFVPASYNFPPFVPLLTILKMKFTATATNNAKANTVGPILSSNPACPLILILLALQWYVYNAYNIAHTATHVKMTAEIKAVRSPKFSMPTARAPRITVKFSHERKVRSFAKKTLGSTRVGRAMRLPGAVWRRGWEDILKRMTGLTSIWKLGVP